jgi:RNA polymerase sigma factor (sigma-70 family)
VREETETVMQNVLRLINNLATRTQRPLTSDEQLLDRFLNGRDEQAFTEILERHGPMVYSVCLRVLGHRQDAEDAFQATFLSLVRKGHLIRRRGALPMWLHRVAFRLACTQRARKRTHPLDPLPDAVAAAPNQDDAARELRDALDAEVQRLPERYRQVLVLCGLQGKSYDEAAHELGCPKGTVAIRLMRGRTLLKRRLAARGLVAAAGGLAVAAAVPSAVAAATVSAAVAVACGAAVASAAPAGVVVLMNAAARDVWLNKCKGVALVLALLGLTGSGASVAAQVSQATAPPPRMPVAPAPADFVGAKSPKRADQSFRPAAMQLKGPGMQWNLNPATMPLADSKPQQAAPAAPTAPAAPK